MTMLLSKLNQTLIQLKIENNMYVIKKMRLNRFVERPIVSNRQLFLAKGECPSSIVSKDTSDCYDQPTAEGATKLKVLGLAQDISEKAYQDHINGNAEHTKLNKDVR